MTFEMKQTVDARDVLDPNALTRRFFRARLLGYFRRMGPDKWDPYSFVCTEGEREIEVLPGLKIQVEEFGAVFRIRSRGKVWRAEWNVAEIEPGNSGIDPRSYFMQTYVSPYGNAPGWGFRAVIAKKLME